MREDRRCQGSSLLRIAIIMWASAGVLALAYYGPQAVSPPGARKPAESKHPEADAPALAQGTTAVLKTKDKLLVTVGLANPEARTLRGTLGMELIGPDGKTIAKGSKQVNQTELAAGYRFEMPATDLAPEKLQLRCRFDKEEFQVLVSEVLVAKAHETTLAAGQEFHAGSTAVIRCGVHGVKSLSETIPLAGALVELQLRGPDKKLIPLYSGKAGANGIVDAQFRMPAVAAGQYAMLVRTQSPLGEEKLEHAIKVKTGAKVLLVTDKPLYQPGQLMHIRALTLRPFDLTPVSGESLTFEIEDGKGNKVFKKTERTSEYGIATVDFQLADEVNMGDYHVRAILGAVQADKTVAVKKYVLPKFKSDVKADKRFYQPKETIHGDLQTDYFFGKPVAGGKVKITASTFDVQFKPFQTWEGKTDAKGHVKFEIKLPDYFVGQPLQKGDALVKLEVKVTDTADHSETINRTYPVSDQSIRVTLIPESGRLVPGMENRVFAAALYPDGSPAQCVVKLWSGRQAKGDCMAAVQTNDAGLAEFKLTPKKEQLRQGQWQQQAIEMLGGNQPMIWGPRFLYDLTAEARDAKGNVASTLAEVNADARGDNLMLRLDKAIYRGGDSMQVDIRSSAGMPTVYLDVVRSGQTMLTRWLDVKDGQASQRLDLPANVFGTLEVHVYQTLASGEIIRDSRVVYAHPREDLKIEVQPDKKVYLPGEEGKITFRVTDQDGKPTPAALGVLIVDEAVYALQEMQPGLEKVYFTLQEELLKPQAQVLYRPNESIDNLVRDREIVAAKQQIAQALLANVKPKPPARWEVSPAIERRRKADTLVQQVGLTLFQYAASGRSFQEYDEDEGRWHFKSDLLKDMVQTGFMDGSLLFDPFGGKLTLEGLARLESHFTADRLARAQTRTRQQQLVWAIVNYTNSRQGQFFTSSWFMKGPRWQFPATLVADAVKNQGLDASAATDAWGTPFRLVQRDKKLNHQTGWSQFDYHELVSAGPDRKFDSADDVVLVMNQPSPEWWWLSDNARLAQLQQQNFNGFGRHRFDFRRGRMNMLLDERDMDKAMFRNFAMPMAEAAQGKAAGFAPTAGGQGGFPDGNIKQPKDDRGGPVSAAAPPIRVREYFPETLLWRPALITDNKGVVQLPVSFADSITTWRLSASASSRGGLLGGVTVPLRVFQDFFVDIDLPVALTQNDEVSFPVAVFNYLPKSQTVKLELQSESWFELIDPEGATRALDLKPNEVTSVNFRIKARRIGYQPLTVKARGTTMSDAIKRSIEVLPDGQRVEQVYADRLKGKVTQKLVIPDHAVPDASKILVKVYPGVVSQLMEGMDGMLRMPTGCMEQTSSSAYPNVLVVDYLRKGRIGSPAVMMKAENYLNAGYQRLLTFERPGGGFDWWGSGPPLVWLSAYGLQEFNDMSKVYPIDRGVIDRTQRWLMQQRAADGTWDKIGATHGVTIEQMGNAKLLLTSYVVWALADSGLKSPELEKSIDYIRGHIDDAKDNAYVLALAANALAAWDAKDDSTFEAIKRLEKLKKDLPEWKACCYPCAGRSLSYAQGDSVTIETTALATLAMLRSGQFTASVNQSLTYLMKTKQAGGTWGSTQGTILALKALLGGLGGVKQQGKAPFTILVNGKEAARGEVTEENSDVLQLFDLKDFTRVGENSVEIHVNGSTNLMYQIVGRHFDPWKKPATGGKPILEVSVDYDRTELSTSDLLRAKATLKYNGTAPTYQVIVDLGIPPGFTADAGDFAEMVGAKKVEKFSITARQVTLYIGDVKPGDVKTFEYSLKPKYPIKAKTPAVVAYEYYTPANRATAPPVQLTVTDKKK
jgi:uncharacterized protein YfaS (alpha-2-macroglobulin family)